MSGQQTRRWILQNKPTGDPVLSTGPDSTFKLESTTLPSLQADQALVKTLYISNDPAQRAWISANIEPDRLYAPPVNVGEVMQAYAVGEVVESTSDKLPKGQLVLGQTGWAEYTVANAAALRPIQANEAAGIRATNFIGALGGPGLTAYYGLIEIARAKAEDVVLVSGAAGATGSMVVQIAKHIVGCKRIIGIAGGQKKCDWVKSLGADECIDYKAATFKEDLRKATEGYVDVYFDNVGGDILDLMLTRVKRFGRIAACGAVATYNDQPGSKGITNWNQIITNRLEVKGFIIVDAVQSGKTGPWLMELIAKVKEGKIKIGPETETVVPTKFEDVPKTWTLLFQGANQGKLVTAIEG